MSQLEEINKYDVLIVGAGMEGALATVVGGLLAQPIIAVPVSVGYGVSKDGETALNVKENPFELIYEGELDKQG